MGTPSITASQFAHAYAERSGMTLRDFAFSAANREVRECDCDYELCEGWQLAWTGDRPWEQPGIPLVELALTDA